MNLRSTSKTPSTHGTATSAARPCQYKALQSILNAPISPSTLRALSILFPNISRTS